MRSSASLSYVLLIYVISIIKNLRRVLHLSSYVFSHLRHQQQSRKEDRKKKLRSLRSRGSLSHVLLLSLKQHGRETLMSHHALILLKRTNMGGRHWWATMHSYGLKRTNFLVFLVPQVVQKVLFVNKLKFCLLLWSAPAVISKTSPPSERLWVPITSKIWSVNFE